MFGAVLRKALWWRKLVAPPLLSVVIRVDENAELASCLTGFARQTTGNEQFELIVVYDGSRMDLRATCAPFQDLRVRLVRLENSGRSEALNAGIRRASAELLLLYEDLRPVPDLVERCITFHRQFPDEGDASLLYFAPDSAFSEDAVTRWAFPRLYAFPLQAGATGWRGFWSSGVTCKKSLFSRWQFNPKYRWLENMEFAIRVACAMDFRIHFDERPAGSLARRLTLSEVVAKEYLFGYYSYQLVKDFPGEFGAINAPYDPQASVLPAGRLAALVNSARAFAKQEITTQRFQMLSALWTSAAAHARAEGWIAALEGKAEQPPGSIGPLLKE